MGVTSLSLNRLQPYIKPCIKMLELGAQNIYSAEDYGIVAKHYFITQGIEHHSIDIAPHQGALAADLREDLNFNGDYDLVTNFGTIEHCECDTLYQVIKNIHEACAINGVMVHENPKKGNWPGHGYHYFTKAFWAAIANECGYELLDLTEEPAMGNDVDGWNVCAVLRKKDAGNFIGKTKFNNIYKKHIYDK